MKNNNYFEIIVGTFVLLCAGFFFFNSFKSAKIKSTSGGYNLIAKFDNSAGIEAGSDVKISGIKVGIVENNTLDVKDYRAVLLLNVSGDVKLPLDSSAKIASAGLLGEKFVELTPGSDEEYLQNSGEIEFTQSSVSLEDLLGKFIFNDKEKKTDKK